ncbi:MAG: uracil-DNA glycosylase [Gammaproteobacteria bacterium]|nr:uracil-DNA glycosylase [Sideroxydans sp.]MBU3903637.1 uracil-DNA glycosylase [Gammaproteobacteria bacterium]MBU4044718.1 uracil-DNA glycosylase [Gammaproteobacteria bacterium]MBU4151224.1 uracil-DNA glycosylase [Gammaproteobacteria bacterium]
MNLRDEHVLRDLNLYPLWVRRGVPAQELLVSAPAAIEVPEVLPEVKAEAPVARDPETVDIQNIPDVGALDWSGLKDKVRDCVACKLRAGCAQTVFGVGDEQADWLFVGEGPGADEDAQGEPFVGQAGKLLDNMLLSIGLKRGDNVYIANIVKCHPPENRHPAADEIATCLPYLHRQIALIKPKLIVALGKTAATALLGRDATLGSLRGTTHDFAGTPLLVTYHPAYLLRSPAEKARAWQDLKSAVVLMN